MVGDLAYRAGCLAAGSLARGHATPHVSLVRFAVRDDTADMIRRSPASLALSLCASLTACAGDSTTAGTESTGAGTTAGPSTTAPTSGSSGEQPPPTGGSTATGGEASSGAPGTTTDATTGGSGPGTGETGETDATTGGVEGGLTRRPAEPIVLVGGQVPGMGAVAADDIVGFAWRDGAWAQVPVQVDERVRIDFCTIYAKELLGEAKAPCQTAKIIDALFYADPNTYTGADTDSKFDIDDELVFMARDAGGQVGPGSAPDGVVEGSGVEVEVVDGDEKAWVYLFERTGDGGLGPDAGVDLISYALQFDGDIDYKTEYPFIGKGSCGDAVCNPPILEDSLIASEFYERHFSARWVTDSLRLLTPNSSGDDLLDIAQARFAPDFCGRHVLTFSTSEGAFIANIDGPVRAIRSYMGANSGPLTQRTHLFYDRVEVMHTFLRVHAIPSIMELTDYAPAAAGMTYYNEFNLDGVAIDGEPDPGFDTSQFGWELVSGPHGSVVSTVTPHFSQPLKTIAYYEDDVATPNDQCSMSDTLDHPDDQAFGTSGSWIVDPIPDTDPRNGSKEHVFIRRVSYYEAADLDLAAAQQIVAGAQDPPDVTVRAHTDAPGEPCGDGVCGADEAVGCPHDCNPFDQTCGDGLCDLWENSVSCAADCSTGMMGSDCGDDNCDPGEHELACAPDCWTPMYEPLVACMGASCPVQLGACNAEVACVDRVVCTAECVGMGGALAKCQTDCKAKIPATMEQAKFADSLLMCAAQSCV